MKFTELSLEELGQVQKQAGQRFYMSQSQEYVEMAQANGVKTKVLAVTDGEEVLAYGVFLYFQHKKLFYKVTAQYGPIMDFTNEDLVTFYFKELQAYFKKDWRVVSLRVSPFLVEGIYEDTEFLETNPLAKKVEEVLALNGFVALKDDYYTDRTLASRHDYVKPLEGLEKKGLLKSYTGKARTCINRCKRYGVRVRPMEIRDAEDARIFDLINRDTEARTGYQIMGNDYFLKMKEHFGDKIHFMLSYIDVDEFYETIGRDLSESLQKDSEINRKLYHGEGNKKKLENQKKELDFLIQSLQNRYGKLKELEAEEGKMLYLSCAVFIESGEDLVYFISGAREKMTTFEGPYAVIHEMMEYALDHDFSYFNFLAVSPEAIEDEASDHGVLTFKRRFMGNLQAFLPSFEKKNGLGRILPL